MAKAKLFALPYHPLGVPDTKAVPKWDAARILAQTRINHGFGGRNYWAELLRKYPKKCNLPEPVVDAVQPRTAVTMKRLLSVLSSLDCYIQPLTERG